jgi:hypothetical protein
MRKEGHRNDSYQDALILKPWSQVLLERPTFTLLVKNAPTYYRTGKFNIVFTRAHNGPHPESDEFTPYHSILF